MNGRIVVQGRPNYRRINLQTRAGNDIENRQVWDFSASELAQVPALERAYQGAVARTKPNPVYNCHGMVFASSRTTIGPEAIERVLVDDGYGKVADCRRVLPGDIILYRSESGEICHSGVVVSRPTEAELWAPWIVSKWGKYGEVYHRIHDSPYLGDYVTVEYWRITKW